jgi:hypothetical protein
MFKFKKTAREGESPGARLQHSSAVEPSRAPTLVFLGIDRPQAWPSQKSAGVFAPACPVCFPRPSLQAPASVNVLWRSSMTRTIRGEYPEKENSSIFCF